jgi:ribosomal protein L19
MLKTDSRPEQRAGESLQVVRVVPVVPKPRSQRFPLFSLGDSVRVHCLVREGAKDRPVVYEGNVTRVDDHKFTVRKISYGVGVERIFPIRSSRVERIELLRRAQEAPAEEGARPEKVRRSQGQPLGMPDEGIKVRGVACRIAKMTPTELTIRHR